MLIAAVVTGALSFSLLDSPMSKMYESFIIPPKYTEVELDPDKLIKYGIKINGVSTEELQVRCSQGQILDNLDYDSMIQGKEHSLSVPKC